jgi:hypothetical protein
MTMQRPSVLRFAPFREDAARGRERITSSLALDLAVVALTIWFIGGVYLDGWAHIHIHQIDTFFTPWHGVLYSGYLATALLLFGILLRNVAIGYPLARALPAGYGLAMLGAVAFAFGAVGDLIWHTIFGIEADVQALLSPTHLILATSAALIVTGPLRAARLRSTRDADKTSWPAVLALAIFYSILTFFSEYASPFTETLVGINRLPASADQSLRFQELGVASFLLQAAILMGVVLFALRRWRLPFGSLTVMLTLNTAAMGLMHDGWFSTGTGVMIGVGLLAGLLGDILVWRLRPSPARPAAFRWFAFLMPAVLYALYYLALFVFGGGVWWSIHLWAGSIFMSGAVGLLVSYLVLAPPAPALEEGQR